MTTMTVIQAFTFAIALLGAVLHVINTWKIFDRDRVKIRVVPKIAFMMGGNNVIQVDRGTETAINLRRRGAAERLSIEITNLSTFPVTISEVGFGKAGRMRHVLFQPEVARGKEWPSRLESREAVTLFAAVGMDLDLRIMTEAVAYAETDCGTVQYGTSPIFEEYVKGLAHRRAA